MARTGKLAVAAGFLSMAMAVAYADNQKAVPLPDLAGHWKLDPAQSDDPRQKMQEARGDHGGEGRQRGGGMGRPGGMGGGRTGGRMGGGGGGRQAGGPGGGRDGRDPGRESMREAMESPRTLSITQTPTEIAISAEDGTLRLLHPDGKKYQRENGSEVRTEWAGGQLVSQTWTGRLKLTESYSRSPGDPNLTVTLLVENPRFQEPVSIRRVYGAQETEVRPVQP